MKIKRVSPKPTRLGRNKTNSNAYFIGGGIASLAGAVFLIRDGKFPGDKITIFEKSDMIGGCLDGQDPSLKEHYSTRGFRILEKKIYLCTLDLFSSIPSLENPDKTILDEFLEFNRKIKTYAKTRLIKDGKKINAKPLKLSFRDRIKLIKLSLCSEASLNNIEIEDYFGPSFFESNFWFEFCTIFSFQPWHSLAEFRRYLLRVTHDLSVLDTVKTMMSMPCNQYDSIILPILSWIKEQGVNFKTNCEVTDLGFESKGKKKIVNRID
ncbi:oleate hydratase, partial [bacterium]